MRFTNDISFNDWISMNDKALRLASFQYDTKIPSKGWDISPIKMLLKNGSRIYSFPIPMIPSNNLENLFNIIFVSLFYDLY